MTITHDHDDKSSLFLDLRIAGNFHVSLSNTNDEEPTAKGRLTGVELALQTGLIANYTDRPREQWRI